MHDLRRKKVRDGLEGEEIEVVDMDMKRIVVGLEGNIIVREMNRIARTLCEWMRKSFLILEKRKDEETVKIIYDILEKRKKNIE